MEGLRLLVQYHLLAVVLAVLVAVLLLVLRVVLEVAAVQVAVHLREVQVILLLLRQAKAIKVETLEQLLCPVEQTEVQEVVELVQQELMPKHK